MSCITSILAISEYPPSGTWTYVGYGTDNIAFVSTPAIPLVNVAAGTALPWGDDFSLVTTSVTPGFYKFTYSLGGTLVIEIVESSVCAGGSKTITFNSTDSNTYSLFDYLPAALCTEPSVAGYWTDVDSAGSAFNDGDFTPDMVSVGTYRFTYRVNESAFSTADCGTCNLEATLTVEVVTGLQVNMTTATSSCNHVMTIEHPNTAAANTVKVELVADNEFAKVSWRKKITNCNGVVVNVVEEEFAWKAVLGVKNALTFSTGGHMETLELSSTVPSTITIPLAPSGANQATLNGVAGSINATDLVYNSASPSTMATALTKAVINYLADQDYFEVTNYRFTVTAFTGAMQFDFNCKHSPVNTWLGIDSFVMTYRRTSGGSVETDTTPERTGYGNGFYANYDTVPCPSGSNQLWYQDILGQAAINIATTTFDTLTLLASSLSIVASPESVLSKSCVSVDITPVVSGCDGTLSYLWSTGETSSSITVTNSGNYSVTLSCTSPSTTANGAATVIL